MTITDFVNKIGTYAPTGWTFYAGGTNKYNMEKAITDTMLMTLPNWPLQFRFGQVTTVTFELWLGKLQEIARTTTQTQQHNPYSPIEIVQAIHNELEEVVSNIDKDEFLAVQSTTPMEFFDSPDGQSVNRQVWAKTTITMKVWCNGSVGLDYDLNQTFNPSDNGETILTDDSGVPLTDDSGNYLTVI